MTFEQEGEAETGSETAGRLWEIRIMKEKAVHCRKRSRAHAGHEGIPPLVLPPKQTMGPLLV